MKGEMGRKEGRRIEGGMKRWREGMEKGAMEERRKEGGNKGEI